MSRKSTKLNSVSAAELDEVSGGLPVVAAPFIYAGVAAGAVAAWEGIKWGYRALRDDIRGTTRREVELPRDVTGNRECRGPAINGQPQPFRACP